MTKTGTAASAAATYTIRYGSRPGYMMKYVMMAPPASGASVRPISVAEAYCPSISPLVSGNRSAITAEMTGPRIAVAIPWKNLTGISQTGAVINRYSHRGDEKYHAGCDQQPLSPDAIGDHPDREREEDTGEGGECRDEADNGHCRPRWPARTGAGPGSWRWSSRILQKSPAGKGNTSSFVQGSTHAGPGYPEHSLLPEKNGCAGIIRVLPAGHIRIP